MKYEVLKRLYLDGKYLEPKSKVDADELKGAEIKQLIKDNQIKEIKDVKK